MNAKAAGGFGDIAAAVGEYALDVLPLGAGEGRGLIVVVGGAHGRLLAAREGGDDIVGIGWFLQVVDGAEAYGVDGGGDGTVAGEDDDAREGVDILEIADDFQAGGGTWHSQVYDGPFGAFVGGKIDGFAVIFCGAHVVVAVAECAGEAKAEDFIVIYDEQGAFFIHRELRDLGAKMGWRAGGYEPWCPPLGWM